MKQIQSDKYTIAWFKIAECVSRGEKERALGVYRLLSHSFNDMAIARQLEGDIYLSFDDKKEAVIRYIQAAQLYEKDNRWLESAAVYEHLLTLQPIDFDSRKAVIRLYALLDQQKKMRTHIKELIEHYSVAREWDEIVSALQHYSDSMENSLKAELYQNVVISLLKSNDFGGGDEFVETLVKAAIDCSVVCENSLQLQEFLSAVSVINHKMYVFACAYLKKEE